MTDRLESLRAALAGLYRVERPLGEGGMATVYLAHDERHDRSVAVKLLHPELIRGLGIERFDREIRIAARLSHPHIVPLLDSGAVTLGPDGPMCPYYVMPLVEGESLRSRLLQGPGFNRDEALQLAREVASALDYAHRQGVVHRDIKPENILLSDGHAVVADFGLARALGVAASVTLTQAGQSMGTPQYMSPEQITGEEVIDGRSDIYSLGCVLYELLTGSAPGDSGTLQGLLAKRLTTPPPRIREKHPEVPEAVEAALVRALAVEREARFQTAAEFGAALQAGAVSGAVSTTGGRRRWLTVPAALAVTAAVGFALLRPQGKGYADGITSLAIAPAPADSATEYLSEGIREAVADLLRRLPQLRVTAPSLVAQIQRQEPGLDAEQLGARLKVGSILTWALRRVADSVQVRAELFRIPGGSLVWSARLARPYADLMAIQGDIAHAISDSLRLQLSDRERASMVRRPTAKAEAYDDYLKGRHFAIAAIAQGSRDAQLLDSARAYAERALEADPDFSGAMALLASWHFTGALRGWRTPFGVHVDSGLALARRVMARDSASGEGWLTVLANDLYLTDQFEDLHRAFDAALRLAPTAPSMWNFYAIYLGENEGRLDSAIVASRRANELESAVQFLNTLGDLYMRRRNYDSAIAVLRRAVAMDPTVSGPQQRLIASYERTGRYAEAVAARRTWRGEAAAAPFATGLAGRGPAGYQAALRRELLARIDTLEQVVAGPRGIFPRDTLPSIPETRLALLYGQLGEWNRAVDWILKEYERRPKRLVLWARHPDMQGVWEDPRFVALAAKAGVRRN